LLDFSQIWFKTATLEKMREFSFLKEQKEFPRTFQNDSKSPQKAYEGKKMRYIIYKISDDKTHIEIDKTQEKTPM
jgi:hypothetical protein